MAKLEESAFEKYVNTSPEPTTAGVLRLVVAQSRQEASKNGPRSGGNILSAPASALFERLEDDSVDLFLTDPPYADVERYSELAELARLKLKPGGLCLAYSGIGYLPDVLQAMGEHLEYHWTISIKFGGQHRAVWQKKVQNSYQPVVAFSKGRYNGGWFTDHLHGGGREKDLHDWQVTQTDVEYLIDKLSPPGGLIVDPYAGSGTTAAAAKKLGRRWLACEVDPATARTARKRLAA